MKQYATVKIPSQRNTTKNYKVSNFGPTHNIKNWKSKKVPLVLRKHLKQFSIIKNSVQDFSLIAKYIYSQFYQ